MDIFSDENRRNPYPLYSRMRRDAPVFRVAPPFDAWLIFDYDGVKRVLSDHDSFSNRVPAPDNWFIFKDPPQHTKLRALISKAFSPQIILTLEGHIRQLSRDLLDRAIDRGEMDLAGDFAVPLPMRVIAKMMGIAEDDWPQFKAWSDTILKISYSRGGDEASRKVMAEFRQVTAVMNDYVAAMIYDRRESPKDDLLGNLVAAQVDGHRLSQNEILGFFQLLIVAGQETTANLINNAMLSLLENPDQLALLRCNMNLLPLAIEEALRFRAPLQWMMRTPTRSIEMHGQTLLPGQLVLPMIGSANRDDKQFERAEEFDITRDPNPHIAFGHGIHFCLGAALARLEAKIALTDLLQRFKDIRLASDEPWEPRKALHVHGPARLPIRFAGLTR
jgi:cytochrome P450